MELIKSIELALGLISILLAGYSFLGFMRLTQFWHQISTLERYQELFAYISVFLASFISFLILVVVMAIK